MPRNWRARARRSPGSSSLKPSLANGGFRQAMCHAMRAQVSVEREAAETKYPREVVARGQLVRRIQEKEGDRFDEEAECKLKRPKRSSTRPTRSRPPSYEATGT